MLFLKQSRKLFPVWLVIPFIVIGILVLVLNIEGPTVSKAPTLSVPDFRGNKSMPLSPPPLAMIPPPHRTYIWPSIGTVTLLLGAVGGFIRAICELIALVAKIFKKKEVKNGTGTKT